ncbi:MAG: hypothetical protein M3O34_13110 [Chloroflexota bacterium]|nr:hypothetical protein [Chloroflexota bacterium]
MHAHEADPADDPLRGPYASVLRLPWLSSSVVTWLALVAYLVVAKVLSLTLVPITFRSAGQESLFDWTTLAVFAVLGLIGVVLADRTGFPTAWDRRISNRQRLLIPVLVGGGIGALAVAIDLLTGGSEAVARATDQPSFNIDFPGSLLAYSAGGILVDVEYRLFTVPFLLWLISSVLLRGRGQVPTFWVLAAVSTLFEPLLQGVGLFILGGGAITVGMLAAYMVTAISLNFTQILFFRWYGLVASVLVRQADYLVWHIVYGNFLYGAIF